MLEFKRFLSFTILFIHYELKSSLNDPGSIKSLLLYNKENKIYLNDDFSNNELLQLLKKEKFETKKEIEDIIKKLFDEKKITKDYKDEIENIIKEDQKEDRKTKKIYYY